MADPDLVQQQGDMLKPDGARTVLRPFHVAEPGDSSDADDRTACIVDRVMALSPEERDAQLHGLLTALERRHDDVDAFLDHRFAELKAKFDGRLNVGREQARLIAAFFTEEFSVETAALFNPSAVEHFDQSGLEEGATRFILSLRGVGEGHVSSLVFQTGVWHADDTITYDARGPKAIGPDTKLPDEKTGKRTAELDFPDVPLGERVVYPFLPSQGRGIEDTRLCCFTEDDGSRHYRGTFTAFDGSQTRQASFTTDDFRHIVGRRLDGDLAYQKGAAWFPRRIDGRFAMLGRLDAESIFLLYSDDPDTWTGGQQILGPRFPWEIVQIGNCGSPVEIDEGWLVLTHGVGRARTYSMGAVLLDRDDPAKVLARTPNPILVPSEDTEGGYVPNVVYSCGAMVRGRTLLLPYGIADNYAAIGTVPLDRLLAAMD